MSANDFSELYEKTVAPGRFTSAFISGHLVVEFLLRKLIEVYDPNLVRHADRLTHARIIALNRDIGTISDSQYEVLVEINRIRNKIAHQLGYEPPLEDLRRLFMRASATFDDSTDGIQQGIDELKAAKCPEHRAAMGVRFRFRQNAVPPSRRTLPRSAQFSDQAPIHALQGPWGS